MKEDRTIEWTLIRRSLAGKLNAEEKAQLKSWLCESPTHRAFYERISGFYTEGKIFELPAEQYENDLRQYVSRIRQGKQQRKRKMIWQITRYAAVLVIFFTVGAYLMYTEGPLSEESESSFSKVAEQAGQPLLITDDGKLLMLDDQRDDLHQIANLRISSNDNGIAYSQHNRETLPSTKGNHLLVIPHGRNFQVKLSDGTVVLLNSETEFRYPVNFVGPTREVRLKGEAYLEVTKSEKPFKVWVEDVCVTVYGTKFNVNAYADKRVQIVLLEGCVGVSSLKKPDVEQRVHPNEMAEVLLSTGGCHVKSVDAETYAAWKDGYFSFDNETLEQIMEKLSRWYNIQVTFQNEQARFYRFSGRINREDSFQGILNMLGRTLLVTFEVNGNEISIR